MSRSVKQMLSTDPPKQRDRPIRRIRFFADRYDWMGPVAAAERDQESATALTGFDERA